MPSDTQRPWTVLALGVGLLGSITVVIASSDYEEDGKVDVSAHVDVKEYDSDYEEDGKVDVSAHVDVKEYDSALQEPGYVDFSFMTSDFRYPGQPSKGFFGTINEWFGGRATSDDVKEEIVSGHTCAKRGSRDETYYGTSHCYWLPEINYDGAYAKDSGLFWIGGSGHQQQKKMCGGINAVGKCMKCSVCHNNARDGGDVDKTSFAEEISMPVGCVKENAIKYQCDSAFDVEVADLLSEVNRCKEVEGRYDRAVTRRNKLLHALQTLPGKIKDEIPGEIQRARGHIQQMGYQLQNAQSTVSDDRRYMRDACQDYQDLQGYLPFMNQLMGATPMETMFSNMHSFGCSYPMFPHDDGDDSHLDEMMRYQNSLRMYNACEQCENAKDRLQSSYRREQSAESNLRSAERRVPQLEDQLQRTKQELDQWQEDEQQIQEQMARMFDEWQPQSTGCISSYQEYDTGKANALDKCAPTFYDQSCEKQCIEQLSNHGCAVIEGALPRDHSATGGLDVQCKPPQPSWISFPYSYRSIDIQEATRRQCEQIEADQPVRRAQVVLKAGWLWKKGRVNGWAKRYFVLESGNAVRSAVLRYFSDDPSKSSNATETGSKGIILRDAREVKEKSGTHYRWKDGEECFKLYHFYRDYRLCALSEYEGKGGVPKAQDGGKAAINRADQEREEWMNLIEQQLGSYVRPK